MTAASLVEVVGSGFVGRSLAQGLDRYDVHAVVRSARSALAEKISFDASIVPRGLVLAAGRATPAMATEDVDPALVRFEELLVTVRDHVVRLGIERVLLVSSAGPVYGESARDAATENTPPSPSTPYGRLKLAEEELTRSLLPSDCAVTALRCTNLYGPQQSAGRQQGLIPIVIRRAMAGEPVTVFGTGDQRRDYFFVEDLADVVVAVLDAPFIDTLNVSVGHRFTVMDIIAAVEAALAVTVSIDHAPAPASLTADQPAIDHRRLQTLLGSGWKPTTLTRGIGATVAAMS